MNLSETAFVAKSWSKDSQTKPNSYTLRWFSPTTEVELCGHATLATAAAIFEQNINTTSNRIKFETKFKGILKRLIIEMRIQLFLIFR